MGNKFCVLWEEEKHRKFNYPGPS